jgi:hypothetical protein
LGGYRADIMHSNSLVWASWSPLSPARAHAMTLLPLHSSGPCWQLNDVPLLPVLYYSADIARASEKA